MKKMQKGSYTVEAALTMPILIFIFVIAMKLGISLYQEASENTAKNSSDDLWVVEIFYKDDFVGGFLDGEDKDHF